MPNMKINGSIGYKIIGFGLINFSLNILNKG